MKNFQNKLKLYSFWLIIFSVFLFLLVILCHVIFGNCQSSPLHYIVQCYFIPIDFEFSKATKSSKTQPQSFPEKVEILPPTNFTGIWKKWGKNGSLIEECLVGNGKTIKTILGFEETINENDTTIYQYKNGLKNGAYFKFNIKDEIIESGTYLNELENGTFIKYYDGINIEEKGVFLNGKKMGKWTRWDKNKNKEFEIEYKDGQKNGYEIHWGKNGNILYSYINLNNIVNGKWQQWYSNGNLEFEGNYENDKKNGVEKHWSLNGLLINEDYYKNDFITKTVFFYKDQPQKIEYYKDNFLGKDIELFLLKTEYYENNKIIKTESFDN